MKKVIIVLSVALLVLSACKKDSPRKVEKMLEEGTWKITYYDEKGTVKTSIYTGDVFTFGEDDAVNATHSSTEFSGTWDCDKQSGESVFMLDMKNPSEFKDISKTWDIIEKGETSLKLSFTDTDAEVVYLTFEKN